MLRPGLVTRQGATDDGGAEVDPGGLWFWVCGERWQHRVTELIVLHKPAGDECWRKPKHHASVLCLLPPPLRQRELQSVERLDADTTGLLLLNDDGALIHRLASPKTHVPKVYEIGAGDPVTSLHRSRYGALALPGDLAAGAWRWLDGPQAVLDG